MADSPGARDNLDTLIEDLAKLNEVVVSARRVVADGQIVSLEPLQDEMDRVCSGLRRLPVTEARSAGPSLLSLLSELDLLATEIAARRDSAADGIHSMASHGKAAGAYGRTPSFAGKGRRGP